MKEEQYQPEGVYRPEEEDYSSYDSSAYDPIAEGSTRRRELELEQGDRRRRHLGAGAGANASVRSSQRLPELEGRGRRTDVQRGELEAESVARIARVQTDGWPPR